MQTSLRDSAFLGYNDIHSAVTRSGNIASNVCSDLLEPWFFIVLHIKISWSPGMSYGLLELV
jgi:hypothetical protein